MTPREEGVAFVLDLTERKQAEAVARETQLELAHANRVATIGQLTASIAHEVKQPITAVLTNAEGALRWLSRRPQDLERMQQALRRIIEPGHRAGDVVDRIRAMVKKAPLPNVRLNINETILEVIELTRAEAAKSLISVQTDLANDLPLIEGDRIQLQQVLLNLIVNAIEAMTACDERRELLVKSQEEKGGVLVAVRDSGPGLAPETVERLFDAFYDKAGRSGDRTVDLSYNHRGTRRTVVGKHKQAT